jgi:hypothetical protein
MLALGVMMGAMALPAQAATAAPRLIIEQTQLTLLPSWEQAKITAAGVR